MPIKTYWYLEPRILMQEYEGEVTFPQIQESVVEMEGILAAHTQKIYILIDFSKATRMPTDIRALTKLARPDAFASMGDMYNFGLNPVSRIISASIAKVANLPTIYVANLDEALKRIREKDPEVAYLLDKREQ